MTPKSIYRQRTDRIKHHSISPVHSVHLADIIKTHLCDKAHNTWYTSKTQPFGDCWHYSDVIYVAACGQCWLGVSCTYLLLISTIEDGPKKRGHYIWRLTSSASVFKMPELIFMMFGKQCHFIMITPVIPNLSNLSYKVAPPGKD